MHLFENNQFASSERFSAYRLLIVLISILFVGRIGQLQILRGSFYKDESEAQAIKQVRKEPFRGNMFDRHGELILHNEPSFSVNITPIDFKEESIPLLASILNTDTSYIKSQINAYRGFSPFMPIKVLRDVDFNIIAKIEELSDFLSGVFVNVDSKRLYDYDGTMAHLLGYTREISKDELKKNSFYQPGDIIGKAGLEKEYEQFLRGRAGIDFVAVNKYGQKVSSFENDKQSIPSNNGFDLHLGLDKKLQLLAEKALTGKRGAVVAIDPRNGEVLIYAVKPDYDPREFSGRVSYEVYKSFAEDEAKPLLNRGVSSAYPPGSSWKMLVAIAALNEGVITENTKLTCGGGYAYGGRFFKCMHNHGSVNTVKAIQGSCNSFFYQTALKVGLNKIIEYGKLFGFGSRTQVDIANENSGNFPSIAQLTKLYKGQIPNGITLNYGIGQGEILVTPMQMAQYVATIANKGTIYRPHVVKSYYNNIIKKNEPFDFSSPQRAKKITIKPEVWEVIQQGMFEVVNVPGGTATHCALPGFDVCGKTSTAQNPHGKDHGWFVCFAPRENPTIALAVMVENMGFGGVVAAPIAKELLTSYFNKDSLNASYSRLKKLPSIDTLKKAKDTNKSVAGR